MAAPLPFSFFPQRARHQLALFVPFSIRLSSSSPLLSRRRASSAYTSTMIEEATGWRAKIRILRNSNRSNVRTRGETRSAELRQRYRRRFRFRRARLCEIERYIKRQNGVWLFRASRERPDNGLFPEAPRRTEGRRELLLARVGRVHAG